MAGARSSLLRAVHALDSDQSVSERITQRGTGQYARVARQLLACVCVATVGCVHAADKQEVKEVAQSADITPVGATRAGNAEGTIPAWTGGLTTAPKGWSSEKGYADPFPADKPLYVIDAKNVDQHKAKLSPGLRELVQSGGNFSVPVYVTRRTAAIPKTVADVAAREAGSIKLDGDMVSGRQFSTVPFPAPKSGAEVMWNHRLHYRGGVMDGEQYWYPVRDGKLQYRVGLAQKVAENASLDSPIANGIVAVRGRFVTPAIMGKDEFFVHETTDASEDSRNWWLYNETQKRVRRLASAGYDDQPQGVDELRTRDQADGFNGNLDRYEWKLVGKRELVVPYNTYKLSDKRLNVEHVLGARSVKPDFMRYELHRVWEVEATLKPGMRHLYSKRTFYVDEDSWMVLLEDVYDSRGKLWRVGVHGFIEYYDVQSLGYGINIWHDLTNGAYLVAGLEIESKKPRTFASKASLADFMPGQVVTVKEGVK